MRTEYALFVVVKVANANEKSCAEVTLRALTFADRFKVRRWMRDLNVIKYTVLVPGPNYSQVRPYSTENADAYLKVLVNDKRREAYAIVVEGEHIGNVGLKEIDLDKKNAECFIEIGESDDRRRGIGTKAMRLLMRRAQEIGLSSLRLGVFEFNAPAIALYERLDFKVSGTYGWHYSERRFWEVYEMTYFFDEH